MWRRKTYRNIYIYYIITQSATKATITKKMKQEKEKEIVAPQKLTNSITMADDGQTCMHHFLQVIKKKEKGTEHSTVDW